MAMPPKSEVLGVVATTTVAALWVYAAAQWGLAEVIEAPGRTAMAWPFMLSGVATVALVWGLRSKRMMKRESK
jgi:predicted Kef-type K+ transport protein